MTPEEPERQAIFQGRVADFEKDLTVKGPGESQKIDRRLRLWRGEYEKDRKLLDWATISLDVPMKDLVELRICLGDAFNQRNGGWAESVSTAQKMAATSILTAIYRAWQSMGMGRL